MNIRTRDKLLAAVLVILFLLMISIIAAGSMFPKYSIKLFSIGIVLSLIALILLNIFNKGEK